MRIPALPVAAAALRIGTVLARGKPPVRGRMPRGVTRKACSPCYANRSLSMEIGNCSPVLLRGKATGRGIASWPFCGTRRTERGCWWP